MLQMDREERLRIRHLLIIIAAVIGLSTQASAAREYYLVGLRHIYMFDVWPDSHKQDRQAIEENFADAVNSAQQQYDADMTSIRAEETQDNGNIHQIDRDAVQQNIEQAIADAADSRDAALGQLYVQCDYMRQSHPEFEVDQDGPYHVVGIDTSPQGDFLYVCYYKPYPTYLDPCPFDWEWEHPYPFVSFGLQVQLFHTTWLSIGSPVFAPMYDARGPITVLAPVRLSVIVNRSSWAGGRPPAIADDDRTVMAANRELQRKAGLRPKSNHPGRIRIRSISPPGAQSKYVKARAPIAASSSGSRFNRGVRTTPGATPANAGTSHGKPSSTGAGHSRVGGHTEPDKKKG
jgi:hypothetical protein